LFVTQFFQNFHNVAGNPFMPLAQRPATGGGAMIPLPAGLRVIPVDVLEDEHSYVLRADLPGMKKEDVHVEVDGQIVRISATKKDTKKWEDEGYKYHRAERRDTMEYSQRALRMPQNTDFGKLEASFDDGTLTVTFGKQPTTTPTAQKISIK